MAINPIQPAAAATILSVEAVQPDKTTPAIQQIFSRMKNAVDPVWTKAVTTFKELQQTLVQLVKRVWEAVCNQWNKLTERWNAKPASAAPIELVSLPAALPADQPAPVAALNNAAPAAAAPAEQPALAAVPEEEAAPALEPSLEETFVRRRAPAEQPAAVPQAPATGGWSLFGGGWKRAGQ